MTDPALARWRDAWHADRRLRGRLGLGAGMIAGLALALAGTIALPPRPLLVWNASASAPMGLYGVSAAGTLHRGDMVIARLPEPMRGLAARRHYLPANVPLVKRVVGVPGDAICANGTAILVNGRRVAARRARDRAGRAMPWWTGCVTLGEDALFLLMTDSPASFDGRYFGPISRRAIVGKVALLWRR